MTQAERDERDYSLTVLEKATIRDLYMWMAEMQTAFQQQELLVDRRRALLTGAAAKAAGIAMDASDTMAIIATNYAIAQDDAFAAMQQEQLRLAAICRRIKAEIDARA